MAPVWSRSPWRSRGPAQAIETAKMKNPHRRVWVRTQSTPVVAELCASLLLKVVGDPKALAGGVVHLSGSFLAGL